MGKDILTSLAISISVEAAELLEHFQWSNDEQTRSLVADPVKKGKITDELADVVIYCLSFSDVLRIDVSEAVKRKLQKTGEKYPIVSERAAA